MRLIVLVGLIVLVAVSAAGCGSGSSSTPTPTAPEGVTTAAQVAEMEKRLAEDEKLRPVYKREGRECEETHTRDEWAKECIAPLHAKLARLAVLDEKLAHELMLEAGPGCREALKSGFVFDRIEEQTIAGCKADIGKPPAESGRE